METPKNEGDELEAKISEREQELRPYIFPPLDREEFEKSVIAIKEPGPIFEERRKRPQLVWLEYLELLKCEKDKNSSLWIKIRNFD